MGQPTHNHWMWQPRQSPQRGLSAQQVWLDGNRWCSCRRCAGRRRPLSVDRERRRRGSRVCGGTATRQCGPKATQHPTQTDHSDPQEPTFPELDFMRIVTGPARRRKQMIHEGRRHQRQYTWLTGKSHNPSVRRPYVGGQRPHCVPGLVRCIAKRSGSGSSTSQR